MTSPPRPPALPPGIVFPPSKGGKESKDRDPRVAAFLAISAVLLVIIIVLINLFGSKANRLLVSRLQDDIVAIRGMADPAVEGTAVERVQARWRAMKARLEKGDADLADVTDARAALKKAGADGKIDAGEMAELERVMAKW